MFVLLKGVDFHILTGAPSQGRPFTPSRTELLIASANSPTDNIPFLLFPKRPRCFAADCIFYLANSDCKKPTGHRRGSSISNPDWHRRRIWPDHVHFREQRAWAFKGSLLHSSSTQNWGKHFWNAYYGRLRWGREITQELTFVFFEGSGGATDALIQYMHGKDPAVIEIQLGSGS